MVVMANKANRAIKKNHQKRPAISDADLEKQVDWVRHSNLQNAVDLSLQATQTPDSDGDNEVIKDVTDWVWSWVELFLMLE